LWACGNCAHDFWALLFLQIDVEIWVVRQECRQHCRQVFQHRDGIYEQPNVAAQALRVCVQLSPHLLQLLNDSAGVLEEQRPSRRKLDTAVATRQQLRSESGLHRTNTLTRSRE
jgi:hypothetical protein